ncbi:MAG: SPFH domain-containing protein, partial [Candidatus Xenobia bacterium]
LSYRVNFEGDPERWFNVENYVKFLTEHMRSVIPNAIKHHGLEIFYGNAINILRDVVLGPQGADGKRPGRRFAENGMVVYDLEVLDVKIGDSTIASLLTSAQHTSVEQAISLAQDERRLEVTRKTEEIKQLIELAQSQTMQHTLTLRNDELRKQHELKLAEISTEAEAEARRLADKDAAQQVLARIQSAELQRDLARRDQDLKMQEREQAIRLEQLRAEVMAVVQKAQAVSPDLIAALQAFSDRFLAERVAQSMSPLAILGGRSVADVFGQLLKGTSLEGVLAARNGNGSADKK